MEATNTDANGIHRIRFLMVKTFKRILAPDAPIEQMCGAMDVRDPEDHEVDCPDCYALENAQMQREDYERDVHEEQERAKWWAKYGDAA